MRQHLPKPTKTNPHAVSKKRSKISTSISSVLIENLPVYVSEYLCIKHLLPLWSQVVLDAVDGSIKGDATDEQNGQNHIGECGCEVHHLDKDRQGGEVRYKLWF